MCCSLNHTQQHPMMAMVNKIVVIKSDLEPQPLQTSLPPAIAITDCVSEWTGLFWAYLPNTIQWPTKKQREK